MLFHGIKSTEQCGYCMESSVQSIIISALSRHCCLVTQKRHFLALCRVMDKKTGNNMPEISLLVEIAEFYDVSIPEIINGERKSEKIQRPHEPLLLYFSIIYSSAFTIQAAILLPPFLPRATIYGTPASRINSLDCTTFTNPTGTPMTR